MSCIGAAFGRNNPIADHRAGDPDRTDRTNDADDPDDAGDDRRCGRVGVFDQRQLRLGSL
jgi:hypothetical protein